MTRGHDSGRHRQGASPLAWTPLTSRRRERAAHALAEADTEVIPVVDDYPDSPAAGLAKFNLGSIPASVTPPRSWRHAAWFAVTASALVLIGLVYAAAALVTGPRKPDVVDALPGLPTAPEMVIATTDPTTTREPLPTEVTAPRTSAAPAATPSRTPRPVPPQPPAPAPPSPTGEPPASPAPPAAPAPPPSRTTVSSPVLVPAPTNPEAMGDKTEEYYAQVVDDPDAAYAMTTGPLYREGPDSIERRYAGIERVEVKAITIDANRGTTRSELRVVRSDGTVTTMHRELTFTYGSDPKISEDSAAS